MAPRAPRLPASTPTGRSPARTASPASTTRPSSSWHWDRSVSTPGSWAAPQLAELLAPVSSYRGEESAKLGAVERGAEALEAEAGALVEDGSVVASVGLPSAE